MLVQSIPYPAGGAGQMLFVASTTLPTSGASLTGNFGGQNASAALNFLTAHTTALDPESVGSVTFAAGCMAGTSQLSYWHRRTTSSTRNTSQVNAVDFSFGSATSVSVTPTTNGIALSNSNTSNNDVRLPFTVFGPSVQASNGVVDLGTGTSAIPVDCGFVPDVVLFFNTGDAWDGTPSSFFTPGIGIAHIDGNNRFFGMAKPNSGTTYTALLNDACAGQVNATAGDIGYKVAASNFAGTGFDLTPTASAGGDKVGYLALKFPTGCKLVDFNTPTTTGLFDITGAGFTPQWALIVTTAETAVWTAAHAGPGFGVGMATATAEFAASFDVNATNNGRQSSSPRALLGPVTGDADVNKATLDSFIADGARLNFTSANGTTRKGFAVFVEQGF